MRSAVVLAVLGLSVIAPVVLAQDHTDLHLVAKETGCTSPKIFCFDAAGAPSSVAAGAQVEMHFENSGTAAHNVYVTTTAKADAAHRDTPAADAVAHTDDAVAGGASDTVTFAVPSGTSKLYYWCDVSGHEELGMWGEIPVQAAAGDGDDDGEGDGNGSPVPVYVALGAILCAVVLFRRKS